MLGGKQSELDERVLSRQVREGIFPWLQTGQLWHPEPPRWASPCPHEATEPLWDTCHGHCREDSMWICLSLSFWEGQSTRPELCQLLLLTEGWHGAVPAVRLDRLADLSFLCSSVCSASRSCRVVKGKRDRRAAGHSASHTAITTLVPIKLPDCGLALMHCLQNSVTNPTSQTVFHQHLFGVLMITKVSFYLISRPVYCSTVRALED